MPPATAQVDLSSTANRDAVLTAVRLVNGQVGPAQPDSSTPAAPRPLPTATFRVAVDQLAGHGTYEALDASMPNLKALIGAALNWSGQPRATKPVTKAIGAAMSGRDDQDASLYPQALEMLTFLALCAPLLEPDRLARVAALAARTPNAYKPIRYLVTPAAQLRKLLEHYGEARREKLLASLWVTAHHGRWWNATSGTPVGPARARRANQTVDPEQAAAIKEQIGLVMRGAAVPTAATIAGAFDNRALTYSQDAARILGGTRVLTREDRRRLAAHAKHPDADVPVLLSYVTALLPDERAESPIPALIATLVRDLAEDFENTGVLPEKPEEWSELYPESSREGFPMPNRMRALDMVSVAALPGAQVTMMRHPDMLKRNADHMGNCTFSYRPRCENGTSFIGHLAYGEGEYNFAISARTHPDGRVTYSLGEINSRFNRRLVPEEVAREVSALIAGLNN